MIHKTYNDDRNIISEAYKKITHHTLGLTPTKNYWIWARPIDNMRVDHTREQLWSASAYTIADSVDNLARWEDDVDHFTNHFKVNMPHEIPLDKLQVRDADRLKKVVTNPIAIFDIGTGDLLWNNDEYYDEKNLKGHGYEVTYKHMNPDDSNDTSTPKRFRIGQSVTPIIIIPAEDDDKLNAFDRVIVAAHTNRPNSKNKLRVELHSICYSSKGNNFTFNKGTPQMKVAQHMFSDGHSLAVIARTVIQEEYVNNILAHMSGVGSKDEDTGEDIRVVTTKVNGQEIPTIRCRNDKDIRRQVRRLEESAAFDDIWITSSPLMKSWDVFSKVTQHTKKISGLRYDEEETKRTFLKLKKHADDFDNSKWIFLITDVNDVVLFGYRLHSMGKGQARYYLHFNTDDFKSGATMWDEIDKSSLHYLRRYFLGLNPSSKQVSHPSWDEVKKTGHLAWFTIFQGQQEHEDMPGFTGQGQINDGTNADLQLDPFLDYLKELFLGEIPGIERNIEDTEENMNEIERLEANP